MRIALQFLIGLQTVAIAQTGFVPAEGVGQSLHDAGDNDLIVFLGLAACLSLVANTFLRRWWIASLVAAVIAASLLVGHEIWRSGFTVRPADLAFWIPTMFLRGTAIALVPSILVGIAGWWVRKRDR